MKKNKSDQSFMDKYYQGPKDKTIFDPWKGGYLRLQYHDEGELEQVAYVKKEGEIPNGYNSQLWFMGPEMITIKSRYGFSGTMWAGGTTTHGTVYDDTSSPGEDIGLEKWIQDGLKKMKETYKAPSEED